MMASAKDLSASTLSRGKGIARPASKMMSSKGGLYDPDS